MPSLDRLGHVETTHDRIDASLDRLNAQVAAWRTDLRLSLWGMCMLLLLILWKIW
jgi:hypothetical protein